MDPRKELSLINKHVRQHHREVGEYLYWFEFIDVTGDPMTGSVYDDVYDEGVIGVGGRSYGSGLILPTIYVEEVEDTFTLREDGRQPTQNLDATMLFKDVESAGLTNPAEYNKHLNDMFWYDFRYYKVSSYRVRGRLPGEVVVNVQGFEVFVDQEFVFDPGPQVITPASLPWPLAFPVVGV